MIRSRIAFWAAVVLTAGIWLLLGVMAPRMYPLRRGTAAQFWYAATGVDLGGIWEQDGGHAIVDGDRVIYAFRYRWYPDGPYETTSLNETEADLPRVGRELAKWAAANDPRDFAAMGYAKWAKIDGDNGGVRGLIAYINAERARQFDPLFTQGLQHVASAARLYWVCIVFEALFFLGLTGFVFWP